jgi:uncharacterized membrane-anchored protein
MILPLLLFFIFTALATGGAYWIGSAQRSRSFGLGLALGTFLFMAAIFAVLALWVWPMMAGLTM